MLSETYRQLIISSTNAKNILSISSVQSLWSGYGEIIRVTLSGGELNSAILKYVNLPEEKNHPRGWNTDFSHQRKIRSYEVEINWYEHWSNQCDESCRVARYYVTKKSDNEYAVLLEDLDAAGYHLRFSSLDKNGAKRCLRWLANFHGRFMSSVNEDLWPVGTYWHLGTRPDEFSAMEAGALKDSAARIDSLLNECKYKTLVHGDAKVANFCFLQDLCDVAMVDFQYVGSGCGMKDVAYFMGSCLSELECEQWQDELLAYYFSELNGALERHAIQIDKQALEKEWRKMFPVAWADFYRFLSGWSPAHHKINNYMRGLTEDVIDKINNTTN